MRPAIRLAALMKLPLVYVFTHDSIFLGEDGPTHQPESQLLSLRAIPGLTVIRPADANETSAAWRLALENRDGPTALILSRQRLPILEATAASGSGLVRGAYVLAETDGEEPRALLLATGSEVSLAREAQEVLESRGVPTRLISMPSWEIFEAQDAAYREAVLPAAIPLRLAIEAGSPIGWERYVGDRGEVLGLESFGESAPAADLAREFGFTAKAVADRLEALLAREGE
jgi:transketolase